MKFIILIDVHMLNHPWIIVIKEIWSWLMIFLICFWIQFRRFLLIIFATMFIIRSFYNFYFFIMSWSSFGIRMIMILYKELKAFFLFYEIIWVVLILDPLWNFSIILQWIHLILTFIYLGGFIFKATLIPLLVIWKKILFILSWFNVSIEDAPRYSTISLNVSNLVEYKFWGYVLMIFWIYCVCWNYFLLFSNFINLLLVKNLSILFIFSNNLFLFNWLFIKNHLFVCLLHSIYLFLAEFDG